MKPVQTPPAQPLTSNEKAILLAFRTMSDRSKRELLCYATEVARAFPHRAKPSLRLATTERKEIRK